MRPNEADRNPHVVEQQLQQIKQAFDQEATDKMEELWIQ